MYLKSSWKTLFWEKLTCCQEKSFEKHPAFLVLKCTCIHLRDQLKCQYCFKGRNSLEGKRQKGVLFVVGDSVLTSGRHSDGIHIWITLWWYRKATNATIPNGCYEMNGWYLVIYGSVLTGLCVLGQKFAKCIFWLTLTSCYPILEHVNINSFRFLFISFLVSNINISTHHFIVTDKLLSNTRTWEHEQF